MGISFCHTEGHLANVPWLTPYSNCHSAGLGGPALQGMPWQAMCPERRSPDTSPCFNLTVRVSDCMGSALTAITLTLLLVVVLAGAQGGLELWCRQVMRAASPGKLRWPVSLLLRVPSPPLAECASLLLPPFSLCSITPPSRRPLVPLCCPRLACPRRTLLHGNFPDPLAGNSSAQKLWVTPFCHQSTCHLPARLFRSLPF